MFTLDPQLERDTIALASLPLCELLLMNDAHYPWLILVPRRDDLRELIELTEEEQHQYLRESNAVSTLLQTHFGAEKLNVAALGNIVAQLHIHHIARFSDDAAWPKPVWGVHAAQPYTDKQLSETIEPIYSGLSALDMAIQWTAAD